MAMARMAMAACARRMAAAGHQRMAAAGRVRWCSKVPTPSTIATSEEEVIKFFKPTQTNMSKAYQLAEELSIVLKEGPPEVAMPKARGLLLEISRVCNVSTIEGRLSQIEVTIKTHTKVGYGIATLFAAYLMGIPSTVYMAKLDCDNQISKVEGRVVQLESASAPSTMPSTLNVNARLSHQIKVDPEANSTGNQ